MNQKIRKLVAIVLTLAMTVSAGISAYADVTNTVYVNDETKTIDDNITIVPADEDEYVALSAYSWEGDETNASVTGKITIEKENGSASGVDATAQGEGKTEVTTGDVSATSDISATGVYVSSYDGGTAIAVAGKVEAEGEMYNGTAAAVYAHGEDSVTGFGAESLSADNGLSTYSSEQGIAQTTITGDINAKEQGIYAGAAIGGQTEAEAEGDVNAGSQGIYASSEGTEETISEEEFEAVLDDLTLIDQWNEYDEEGNLTYIHYMYEDSAGNTYWKHEYVEKDGSTWPYYTWINPQGGSVVVKVGGDLNVEGENASQLLYSYATSTDGSSEVTVGGNATLDNEAGDVWEDAIEAHAKEGGQSVTVIEGSVVANTTTGIYAESDGQGSETSVAVIGDLSISNEDSEYATAMCVDSTGEAFTYAAVYGDVTSTNEYGSATGVYFQEAVNADVTAVVGGDLTVSAPEGYVQGIQLDDIAEEGSAIASVGGDITLFGGEDGGRAIYADVENAEATINVGGNVTIETENGYNYGITLNMDDNATVTASVDGDVTVTSLEGSAIGVSADSGNSDGTVTIGGDVVVNSDGFYAQGIYGCAYTDSYEEEASDNEASLYIQTDGDMMVAGGEEANGVVMYSSGDGAIAYASVGGDVAATADYYAVGVTASAYDEAITNVDVSGDIVATADEYATGISAWSGYEGSANVWVDGGVTAVSEDYGTTGIYAESYDDGLTSVYVGGDVYAIGSEENTTGVYTYNDGGLVSVIVDGDVVSDGIGLDMNAQGYQLSESETNLTEVTVIGDVIAADTAASITLENDAASMDLLVDGTLSGEHAIVLSEQTVTDNLTLTVWEVVPNEDGNLVERLNEDGTYEADKETEKKIQYIIRMDQNVATEGTTDYEGYDVAHEGDTVVLKVNVPAGYVLDGAFNGTDTKVTLEKNEKGEYFLVVPKGGAVMLSVTMYKTEKAKKQDITDAVEKAAGENASVSIEIEKDPETKKYIVEVKPEEGAKEAELTLDKKAVNKLLENGASTIRMENAEGTTQADISVKELKAALDKAPGSELIIDMKEDTAPEMPADAAEKYDVVDGGIDVIKIVLKDADGNETEVPNAKVTLKIQVEYQEGMKIMYIDAAGNATEAETEWIAATDGQPGYAKVVYAGYGAYLPVMPKK